MIRPASLQDARTLAEVNARAWLRAYGDVVPPDRLVLDVDEVEQRFAALLASGERAIAVFELADHVAGYVATGAPSLEDEAPGTGQLHSLYVDPPAQGAGVGGVLHAHAIDALRSAGYRDAMLWSFRDNGQARAFYETRGWTYEEGSEARAPSHWMAPSVRYRRPL